MEPLTSPFLECDPIRDAYARTFFFSAVQTIFFWLSGPNPFPRFIGFFFPQQEFLVPSFTLEVEGSWFSARFFTPELICRLFSYVQMVELSPSRVNTSLRKR